MVFEASVPLAQLPLMRGIEAINVVNAMKRDRGIYAGKSQISKVKKPGEQHDHEPDWYSLVFHNLSRVHWMPERITRFIIELRVKELAASALPAIFKAKQLTGEFPALWPLPVEPGTGEAAIYERLPDGGFVIRRTGSYTNVGWEWRFP